MPDEARVVRFDDGLEVLVLEGDAGVRLGSYRRMLRSPALKLAVWPTAPSAEFRDKRFTSIDELIGALRHKLGI
jgi:hypothetical protein